MSNEKAWLFRVYRGLAHMGGEQRFPQGSMGGSLFPWVFSSVAKPWESAIELAERKQKIFTLSLTSAFQRSE